MSYHRQPIALGRVGGIPSKQVQLAGGQQGGANPVKHVGQRGLFFVLEADGQPLDVLDESLRRLAGEERMLAVENPSAIGQCGRPLPDLLARRLAGVDQDVLVVGTADLSLHIA